MSFLIYNAAAEEGVFFKDEDDAKYAATGKQTTLGVATIAEHWRETYGEDGEQFESIEINLDQPKVRPLFCPSAMPERDAYGFASHPDLISTDDEILTTEITSLYEKLGFQSCWISAEHPEGVVEEDAPATALHWNPQQELDNSERGKGYQVISIFEAEDCIAAHAIKPFHDAKRLFVEA